jgi:hypothetical protein
MWRLMSLKKQPRSVCKGEHDPLVWAKVPRTMVEDGVGHNPGSSRFEMNVASDELRRYLAGVADVPRYL